MALTPIAGVSPLRVFELGKETTFRTRVPTTRRMPWNFTPTVQPNWTNPTADTGHLDPAIAPYRLASDITGQAVGELYANDAPFLWAALIKSGITPSTVGTSGKYWGPWTPSSTSQDSWETYSAEHYDDATGDAFAYVGGVLDKLQLSFPQNEGPILATADWRFADVVYPATPTGGNAVDLAPTPLFCADTALYINDAAGVIGTTQIVDTMYDASITISNNLDVKRFANGNSTRFVAANYGRGARLMETTFTLAKSAAAIAETVKWLNASPIERFVALKTTSVAFAGIGTPYQQTIKWGGYWFTRTDQTVNSNTAIQLVCHNVYDPTLTYPFSVDVTNTLATN